MRRTAGFSTNSSPIGPASPGAFVTMLSTPAGKPASPKISAQIRPPEIGDHSEGLRTTVLPNAIGAVIPRSERISAAFQGAIAPTTPDRLADTHGERPGQVGGDDLPHRLVARIRGLAQCAGREAHLEHAEAEGTARLAGEELDDLVAAALQDVGRAQEQRLARRRRRLRPRGECLRGGFDRPSGVVAPRRRNARDHVARVGVAVVERAAFRGLDPLAADV